MQHKIVGTREYHRRNVRDLVISPGKEEQLLQMIFNAFVTSTFQSLTSRYQKAQQLYGTAQWPSQELMVTARAFNLEFKMLKNAGAFDDSRSLQLITLSAQAREFLENWTTPDSVITKHIELKNMYQNCFYLSLLHRPEEKWY